MKEVNLIVLTAVQSQDLCSKPIGRTWIFLFQQPGYIFYILKQTKLRNIISEKQNHFYARFLIYWLYEKPVRTGFIWVLSYNALWSFLIISFTIYDMYLIPKEKYVYTFFDAAMPDRLQPDSAMSLVCSAFESVQYGCIVRSSVIY